MAVAALKLQCGHDSPRFTSRVFHGLMAVAALKQGTPSFRLVRRPLVLHGLMAVAVLKQKSERE